MGALPRRALRDPRDIFRKKKQLVSSRCFFWLQMSPAENYGEARKFFEGISKLLAEISHRSRTRFRGSHRTEN